MKARMTGRNTAVIIAAAGSGSRMGGGVPKQYRRCGDLPVLAKAAKTFCDIEGISRIVAAVPPGDEERCRELFDGCGMPQVEIVCGGATRQISVATALEYILCAYPRTERVLVHDAARPFADEALIRRVLCGLESSRAAVPCVHPKNTVRTREQTLDRASLYEVQTPQGFDAKLLHSALAAALDEGFDGTDEAGAVERYMRSRASEDPGEPFSVLIVEGSYANYKITTPEDLPMAIRTGNGYDVHRLAAGRKLMLGCTHIPFDKGLLGHSDADVLAHAVADALLGACALGDIGRHFPDSEPSFEGISGREILERTADIVRGAGFEIVNVDATLIAQLPKIAPFASMMRENTARALGLPAAAVSIKATTEEGLGFTGDGSAMAAFATASVK